jgi:hypothetical protein
MAQVYTEQVYVYNIGNYISIGESGGMEEVV